MNMEMLRAYTAVALHTLKREEVFQIAFIEFHLEIKKLLELMEELNTEVTF